MAAMAALSKETTLAFLRVISIATKPALPFFFLESSVLLSRSSS